MPMEDLFSLRGKVAVVIGGSGVLAGEMAQALAAAGSDIVVVGQTPEKTEARAAQIRTTGQRAIALIANAANRQDLQQVLARTLDEFGRLDILMNAAGINS